VGLDARSLCSVIIRHRLEKKAFTRMLLQPFSITFPHAPSPSTYILIYSDALLSKAIDSRGFAGTSDEPIQCRYPFPCSQPRLLYSQEWRQAQGCIDYSFLIQ
jgi:hypothetical protein